MSPTQVVVRDGKDLVNLVVACAPFDWNEAQMRFALDAILARAVSRGMVWGTDWINCWPQSDGEWLGVLEEAREMYGNDPLRPEQRELLTDEHDQAKQTELANWLDQVEKGNEFLVGATGDRYVIAGSTARQLTADECLNLAAWLVGMVDIDESKFLALLNAVRNT